MVEKLGNQSLDNLVQPQEKDCSVCVSQRCRKGKNCYPDINAEVFPEYAGDNLKMSMAAAIVEGQYYNQATRLEEIGLFARAMGYDRLGIATCIGLMNEAQMIAAYLKKQFQVYVIGCKNGGALKSKLNLHQINAGADEVMCNPIGQAMYLNRHRTDMNIICGLCVGHDMLFTKYSDAPVTTIIAKDRMLGHNPAAVLYSSYYRKKILGLEK